MGNNLHLLDTLKDKLVNSDNFSEVMHYFFDHFAENDEFMELGSLRHSNLIETIAIEAATSALGEKVVLRDMRLVRLPKQKFYHGPCFVNQHIATIFFFEEIQTGMMAISLSSGAAGEMLYARITAVAIAKSKAAKWN